MRTVILFVILGCIYGISAFNSCQSCVTSDLADAIAVCAFFGAIFGAAIATAGSLLLPTHVVVREPIKLLAMRSVDGVSGTFVWGSGGFGNKTSYNFLQAVEDGSMVPGSVEADGLVHLIEDTELQNVGYWRTTVREVKAGQKLKAWFFSTDHMTKILRQEFRVPLGTVLQQFSVK